MLTEIPMTDAARQHLQDNPFFAHLDRDQARVIADTLLAPPCHVQRPGPGQPCRVAGPMS